MKILLINGPNLNMLGVREPEFYGKETLQDLYDMLDKEAESLGDIEILKFQSNHEGAIVDRIHEAYFEKVDGIIINPAAYTHTSVALLDALKTVMIPAVEVHISDVSTREDFRQVSYVRLAAKKTIMGLGLQGYVEALRFLNEYLR